MQERVAGTSFLYTKDKDYKLGSYVPEIDMEDTTTNDNNNEEGERKPPPDDYDPSSGRGAQGEMW